jgi:hypothetical protein
MVIMVIAYRLLLVVDTNILAGHYQELMEFRVHLPAFAILQVRQGYFTLSLFNTLYTTSNIFTFFFFFSALFSSFFVICASSSPIFSPP